MPKPIQASAVAVDAASDAASTALGASDDVRNSASPRDMLLDFLQSTYEAGATLGRWDRTALER